MKRACRLITAGLCSVLAACATVTASKPRHEPIYWVTRQIAQGYFPAPGICEGYAKHTRGAQQEALLRCAIADFDGAVYWAQLALDRREEWTPKPYR